MSSSITSNEDTRLECRNIASLRVTFLSSLNNLKDECPVDALRACVFIYLPYILKINVEFRRK